ncbi:MAG: DUF134 domain-containing protein [Candidatus Aenigmarchaeota archaeon]|nr:DUF134 domain-containing protein [Candidatus Aenigmarchaeota archaeon]
MPRPRRLRRIRFLPTVTNFSPVGSSLNNLEDITLTLGELEAIRLRDMEGLDQSEAAKKMNISQPTFNRILNSARKKIADSLINGKRIRIEGGVYKMVGRGRMGGFGAGPTGDCVCPKCGYRMPHQRGVPCYQQKCPKCGTPMTRG